VSGLWEGNKIERERERQDRKCLFYVKVKVTGKRNVNKKREKRIMITI